MEWNLGVTMLKNPFWVKMILALMTLLMGIVAIGALTAPLRVLQLWPADNVFVSHLPIAGPVYSVLMVCILSMICLSLGTLLLPETPSIDTNLAELSGKVLNSEIQLKEVEKEVSQNLERIIGILKSHSEFSNTFAKTLELAGKNLIELTSPEQLRVAIGFLITENNKMRKETSNLQSDLTMSKLKVESLRQSLELAEETGLRDPLTALWNRRAFEDLLNSQIEQAESNNTPVSLILSDIDHFKKINDTFGHLVGDDVLRLVSNTIAQNVKGRDSVSRFGGEEFAIILPETSLENALVLALQIKDALAAQHWSMRQLKGSIGQVTASFGVAQFREGEKKVQLLERADQKLYQAKKAGRNCVMG